MTLLEKDKSIVDLSKVFRLWLVCMEQVATRGLFISPCSALEEKYRDLEELLISTNESMAAFGKQTSGCV